MEESQPGIELHTSFFPLMFILYLDAFNPAIRLNGETTQLKWGKSFIDAPPGSYEVEVFYNYLFGPASIAKATVKVPESGSIRLNYSAPPIVFLAGKLTQKPGAKSVD